MFGPLMASFDEFPKVVPFVFSVISCVHSQITDLRSTRTKHVPRKLSFDWQVFLFLLLSLSRTLKSTSIIGVPKSEFSGSQRRGDKGGDAWRLPAELMLAAPRESKTKQEKERQNTPNQTKKKGGSSGGSEYKQSWKLLLKNTSDMEKKPLSKDNFIKIPITIQLWT